MPGGSYIYIYFQNASSYTLELAIAIYDSHHCDHNVMITPL